jgi:DNA polymerase III alpha subunit
VDKIIEERKNGGKFKTLSDFITRTFVKNFNKKSWEALAKCGALDGFGERNQLLSNTDYVLNVARSFAKEKESGASSLFGEQASGTIAITLTETETVDPRQKLAWEKELLGLYVSSHPLEEFKGILAGFGESVVEMKKNHKERRVTFGGIITKVKTILTKKGDQMCFAEVEDLTAAVELVVFPKTFNDSRSILIADTLVKISGKFTEKDGEPKILADKIESLERSVTSDQLPGGEDLTSEKSSDLQATSYPSRLGSRSEADKLQASEPQSGSTRQRITIPIPEGADPNVFQKLKRVFEEYPGEVAVTLSFPSPHGFDKKVETEFKVSADDKFKKSVKQLLRIS